MGEKDLRAAIATLIQRKHDGAAESEWPAIIADVKDVFGVHARVVRHVLEKMKQNTSPAQRRPGAGRKGRISPGTEKADMIVGGLLQGFGVRRTTQLVN